MHHDHPGWRIPVVLTASVLAISASAVLVRGMEAEPLAIAAWRTTGATLLLGPAWIPSVRRLEGRDRLGVLFAGACLGAHFATWFASLQLTTVLRSTLLVCTTPLWAGLLDVALTGRWPRPRFLMGLVLAIAGVAAMTVAPADEAAPAWVDGPWLGDVLALGGAVLAALYLRVSQSVRQRVGAPATMGLVCASAAALLWVLSLASGQTMTGFPPTTWLLLLGAVLGPQLVGHQGFTWAVRWVPAATVALVVLLEPLGAAMLAALFLGEIPGPGVWVGGLLAVGGLAVAIERPEGPSRR